LNESCPFCRTPSSKSKEEGIDRLQKRVAAKDPEAIRSLGDNYYNGSGFEKDASRAFELWSEAAELGSTAALSKMGFAHHHGDSGLKQDEARGIRYWETAAKRGDALSRHNLGTAEAYKENDDRAVRHFMISAKMGYKLSLDMIQGMFAHGQVKKAQYAEALKGYQDAVEEMKSPQRDEAARRGTADKRF